MGCSGCTACCYVLKVEAIGKASNTECQHCDERGCTIYDKRPDACRSFNCAYLVGSWRIELRPDNCGVIIYNDLTKGYQALMFVEPQQVDPLIMTQIEFIEKTYHIKIHGIDARRNRGSD